MCEFVNDAEGHLWLKMQQNVIPTFKGLLTKQDQSYILH